MDKKDIQRAAKDAKAILKREERKVMAVEIAQSKQTDKLAELSK